jgi:DNA invertase Pin-like site-specific DNA recombinase
MSALHLVPSPAATPCAYVRISDDRTGENASIARQKKLIRELAARQGIDPDAIRWFEDKSKSASRGLRPAFVELLAAVRNGEASVVLVWVADRLWRNADDQQEIHRVLAAARVKVHAAQGNDLDFTTAEGRFTGRVVGAASSFEVERKKERVVLAAEDRARKGRYGGGVRRFGYRQEGTRIARTMDAAGNVTEELRPSGRLVLVPQEAAAVADGYRMMLAGASLNAVTRDWRARGLNGVQGGPLTPMVVREVLLRAANAGLSTYKGEVVGQGDWPAITDPDTWAAVAALLNDPSRRTTRGRPSVHLLSGILRCATCGGPLLAGSKSATRGLVYRCRSGRELPERSTGVHSSRRRERLDEAVADLVLRLVLQQRAALTQPAAAPKDRGVAQAVDEAARIRAKIDGYLAQAAAFDPADLAALLRGLRTQLAEVEARIVTAAGRPATQALVQTGSVADAWAALDVAARRAVIKENISRIMVGPGVPSRYADPLRNVTVFDRDGNEVTV